MLLLLCVAMGIWLHEPLPEASPSPEADALARRVASSVDIVAWSETGVIEWTFAGRTTHLWDRERDLLRVRWSSTEVLMDLTSLQGHATVDGKQQSGPAADALLQQAYSSWVNDAFWLNPLASLFDEGTTRAIVSVNGSDGLLLSYSSGGQTPGDSYLWLLGPDDRPTAWRMWVSVIPIGGVECSWEGWQQLSTGAWVATRHRAAVGPTLKITNVRAAAHLTELTGGEDPFAVLLSN